MSRPHPKANTTANQGEGRVYGKGLWKNETEGIEQVSVAGDEAVIVADMHPFADM
jgi:hypothetical protein